MSSPQTALSRQPAGTSPETPRSYLGQLLLREQKISVEDLDRAVSMQERLGGSLGQILIRLGAVSEEDILQTLASALDIPLLDPEQLPQTAAPYLEIIEQSEIDPDWWLDQEVLCWQDTPEKLFYVARDIQDPSLQEILERAFPEHNITPCLTSGYELEKALETVAASLRTDSTTVAYEEQLRELAEEAPVIEFVNNLLSQAFSSRASDIHIEPDELTFDVRFRIDGILFTRYSLPMERFAAISSRVKLIAGMDISERRLPQDGRLSMRLSGQELDIRVSALPGIHGESIVLRLLTKEGQEFHLDNIGFDPDQMEMLRHWFQSPHGILLVTGPTGSGKSTTLYSILQEINDRKRKIITVEEPVEYRLSGITQVQAKSEIGYNFASALRSILRQDPDVIMIGEIRDTETAEIAIQSSLTGHLVLSTLHTNDAVSAFTRLTDMGIEPFLVAAPIRGVMAQRLVRRLCPECAKPFTPDPALIDETRMLSETAGTCYDGQWKEPVGCPTCQGTGYLGRIGIFELVPMTAPMRELILQGRPWDEMKELATNKQRNRTLRQDGFLKASRGLTSIEEVLRVTVE